MTVLMQRPQADLTRLPRGFRLTEWIFGFGALIAAAVGAWMYYVPADWFLGGLAEAWYFGMFIGAGALLALAAGFYARQMFRVDAGWTGRVIVATLLTVIGLAEAFVFATILIL